MTLFTSLWFYGIILLFESTMDTSPEKSRHVGVSVVRDRNTQSIFFIFRCVFLYVWHEWFLCLEIFMSMELLWRRRRWCEEEDGVRENGNWEKSKFWIWVGLFFHKVSNCIELNAKYIKDERSSTMKTLSFSKARNYMIESGHLRCCWLPTKEYHAKDHSSNLYDNYPHKMRQDKR